jgi:hypothetical protein
MADTTVNKESMIPVINDHPQVVTQPVDKEPAVVEGQDARWKDHPPRLSKNMKLSMRHLGFKENAINVSEEWKFENGEAVPPVGRDTSASYTKPETTQYKTYGTLSYEQAVPFKDDPAGEVTETLKFTEGTTEAAQDAAYVDAVPAMALHLEQAAVMKLEGRHGEVSYDPISNENYLTRPGMEVKTSETYLATLETEAVEPADAEEEQTPKSAEVEPVKETPVEKEVAKTVQRTRQTTQKTTTKEKESEVAAK